MGNVERNVGASTRSHNRIAAVMAHTARYSFRSVSRLASDSGLSKSTVCHLVRGKASPLYITAARIVKCLEKETRRPIDCTELFSEDGWYPTSYVCDLVGCNGCLPDVLFDADGSRTPGLEDFKPGRWTGDTCEFLEGTEDAA